MANWTWQEVALVALGAALILTTGPLGIALTTAGTVAAGSGAALIGGVVAVHDPKKAPKAKS